MTKRKTCFVAAEVSFPILWDAGDAKLRTVGEAAARLGEAAARLGEARWSNPNRLNLVLVGQSSAIIVCVWHLSTSLF